MHGHMNVKQSKIAVIFMPYCDFLTCWNYYFKHCIIIYNIEFSIQAEITELIIAMYAHS